MTRQPRPRVLLTYSRSLMALTAAQSLSDHGIDVVGCDSVDMTVLQFSKHCRGHKLVADHREKPETFINDLIKAAHALRPRGDAPYVLMPIFEETSVIARFAGQLREAGLIVAAPDHGSIVQVEPKDRLPAAAEAAGVAFPRTIYPDSREALDAALESLAFPLITKPARGVGGRGVARHDSAEKLKAWLEAKPPASKVEWPLLQEVAPGDDYCFCALCEDGELRAWMTYRSLHGFPPRRGAGVLRETVDSAPFKDAAATLLRHLKWSGVCEIDYRWTGQASDAPALIEVNPRFWAGLFQSVASGVDFPWLLYRQVTGDPVLEPPKVTIGRRSKVPLLAFISAAQTIAKEDSYFKTLSERWNKLADREQKGFGAFVNGLFDVKSLGAYLKALRATREQTADAATDFIPLDDPGTTLGVLFVLSSMIRRGELPPELRFDE
ncbi:MAG: ATP-grasp domain-containing protein [Oceanicaulis sp.]|nr:ATP-grasp domain-containing protein [Oceanicaulis sp.]